MMTTFNDVMYVYSQGSRGIKRRWSILHFLDWSIDRRCFPNASKHLCLETRIETRNEERVQSWSSLSA